MFEAHCIVAKAGRLVCASAATSVLRGAGSPARHGDHSGSLLDTDRLAAGVVVPGELAAVRASSRSTPTSWSVCAWPSSN